MHIHAGKRTRTTFKKNNSQKFRTSPGQIFGSVLMAGLIIHIILKSVPLVLIIYYFLMHTSC